MYFWRIKRIGVVSAAATGFLMSIIPAAPIALLAMLFNSHVGISTIGFALAISIGYAVSFAIMAALYNIGCQLFDGIELEAELVYSPEPTTQKGIPK